MSGLDLDKLKSQWAQESQKLDDSLTLDVAAVREALTRKTVQAFRRHSYWQVIGLVFSVGAFIALIVFIINNWADKIHVLMAAPLAMLALGEAITDFRELRASKMLNFDSPMFMLNETLNNVRDRRLRMTKWIFLTAVLLWWPLVFVLFKGLFGVDLIPIFHPSFHIINTIVGLACIPLTYGLMHVFSKRYANSPGFKNFLEETAGKSWSRARQQLDARQRFDDEVATHGEAKALQRKEKKKLASPVADAMLHKLKNRILVASFSYGTMILVVGLFNAHHGGQWQFFVPGIFLNFFFVSHMISSITHRLSLKRLDLDMPDDELCMQLEKLLDMRRMFARIVLSLSPIFFVVVLQVTAKAFFGLNLASYVSAYFLTALLIALIAGGLVIYRKIGSKMIDAYANVSGFGAFRRSKILIDAIKQAAAE